MMKEFYVTVLNLDDTSKQWTGSLDMFDGATAEDARKYFTSQCEERHLILSVWDVKDIKAMSERHEPLPPEIARHLGTMHFDDEGTLMVDNDDCPPFNQDDVDAWDAWYGRSAPPPDPFDSGKFDQDDEDYEDGDEWKKLLK